LGGGSNYAHKFPPKTKAVFHISLDVDQRMKGALLFSTPGIPVVIIISKFNLYRRIQILKTDADV
jgi:hypothetical protein